MTTCLVFTLPPNRADLATSRALRVRGLVDVGRDQFCAADPAMSPTRTLRKNTGAAQAIHSVRDWFQMRRITAPRIPTQVIEVHALGNRADKDLVHHAVRESFASANTRRAISQPIVLGGIDPTLIDACSVEFDKRWEECVSPGLWLMRHGWEYST